MKRTANCLLFALVACLFPSVAHAHTGIGETSGFMNGVIHPVTGLDHICAMVAVGLWAAQRGGKAIWLVPLTFVSVMALGGWLGMMGHALPFVEQGIVASVLILGVLIAAAIRLPLLVSVLIVGLFALFHGHAHGAEMPDTASGLLYGLGFIFSTLLLHLCGIALGLSAQRFGTPQLIRYAGVAIIGCGLFLCVAG
ncbi:MAG TPA: HupE/UreJ family protein [Pirellulales bacterium]|nr:HupE/UreJ family protein [Pirellulales bacterium]